MVHSKRITEAKQNLGVSYNIKTKAKELRKNLTSQELILWNKLRRRQQNGMHFRRQHPYGIYILDFFCFHANLVVEVDGKIHMSQKEYDRERTRFLKSSGLRVIRIKNEDIELRIDWVIKLINKYLPENLTLYQPIPGDEGGLSFSPLGETGKGVTNLKYER